MCTRHTRSQVQRQRFRWQASGSEEQPSESLPEEGPGGVCVFEWMCVWSRLSTHPSLEWRRCLRPGGRGRTRRASTPDGSSLRSREQQRYCREVAAETERITFMLLLAAVEHAIGKTCLFFISVAATPATHTTYRLNVWFNRDKPALQVCDCSIVSDLQNPGMCNYRFSHKTSQWVVWTNHDH